MTETSKALSVVAYYLSEYDMEAVHALGFTTQHAAFKQISVTFNRDNNYLKLRRDEFDALPDSSSHRKGWRNRPAAKEVVKLAAHLKQFSFDELTEIVKSLIDAQTTLLTTDTDSNSTAHTYSEAELENLINFEDATAAIRVKVSPTTVRIYNPSIIRQLKRLYGGHCQLCGRKPFQDTSCDITEVHHIDYFANSHNNNLSNLIVLCPNHHRLIHKLNPVYDRERHVFTYVDGKEEYVTLNYHL